MTRVTGSLACGTLLYISPEQLHGASPKPAQDVYSFAAMVYECLTGKPPFCRGQIEYQIEHDMPEPIDGVCSIAGGVMAGLAKQAVERPATCAAVLTVGCKAGEVMALDLPGGLKMEFVWCPATTSEEWKRISGGEDFFWMGSPDSEKHRGNDEIQHRVKLTQGFGYDVYTGDVVDPTGPASGCDRVCRGGSFALEALYCRSAHRLWYDPLDLSCDLGFCLVCSAGPRR